MDVCVTEAVVIKSTKGSDIVFYLEIHCGHWIWENVKTYPEIAALHTKVLSKLRKDSVPALPELELETETIKGTVAAYFGELVTNQQAEPILYEFFGNATLLSECKPLTQVPFKEGFLKLNKKPTPFYFIIIEDSLYYFAAEVLNWKPNQLPLGNISLTDAVLSQNGNKINVQLSEEKHELEASSEEDANTWLIAIKKGSEHTDESGGSSGELNIQQQRSLAQMKEEFPNTPDGDLIRFLKAKAWNADLASTLYKADQVWRQDVGIDRLKITSVYPHLITGKISTTGGVDKMGRIVLLTKARVHDPSSDFMETYLPSIYLIEKVLEGKDPNQQLILINDLTGFEKKHIDFRMYKLVLEMILAHYPERVGAIYCVSAPWTFTMIFKIIKPWLGSELISRVHIFSGYLELKQFIDDDQLLTEFGGKKVFDMKQWAAERAAIEGVSLQDVNTEKATHQFGNEEIVASFSDAPVSHTQEGSTKYGWMKKQGGFVKKFNKRYCVLKGSILYYYRGQNDQKAEGVVPLRKATLAYDNSQTFRIITMAGKDCIFQLTDKKRDWIETLEISILQNDGQIGTLHDSSSDPYDSIGMEGSQPLPALAKQTESIDDLVNAVYQLYADKINGKNDAQTAQGPLSGSELLQYLSDKLGLASNDSKALATRLLKYCFLQSTTGPSTSFSDSSSASYILGIHSKTTVLNAIRLSNSQAADPLPLVKQLHEQLVQLIQQFTVNGKVDLDPLRSSKQYFQFLLATTELQRVNLQANTPPVFFYNVRNILLLHAQLALGPSKTTFNRYQIFNEFQYVIGGSRYSVSDIGNGILRGNIPPVESTLPSHFDKRDTRVKFAVKKVEPKSIFSLFLGITIDPFHFSENYENTIQLAANNFMQNFVTPNLPAEIKASYMLTFTGVPVSTFLGDYVDSKKKPQLTQAKYVYSAVDWSKLGLGDLL